MNWESPGAFFAMGGYGLYVWGAYGVTLACLLADPLFAALRHRRALRAATTDDDESSTSERVADAGHPVDAASRRELDPAQRREVDAADRRDGVPA